MIAGGRRLEALRELQAEGKLPGDHAVPCQVASDEHALEMSLAENTVRLAMHPADEFEAFARLIDGGESVEQIAERFGVTARHVEQRLRLGKAAPELLDGLPGGRAHARMPDGLHHHRRPREAVAGVSRRWRTGDGDPATSGRCSPIEMAEAEEQAGPLRRAGRLPRRRRRVACRPVRRPGLSRKPRAAAPTGRRQARRRPPASWKPKAGNGWRSAPTAIGASSTVAAGFTRSRWRCRRS